MTYLNQVEPEANQQDSAASKGIRIGQQAVGLVLIVIGAWYAVMILGSCIGVLRDPAGSAGSIATMTRIIGLENAELSQGTNKIPIGRISAAVLLLIWYQLSAWISLKLMAIGGRMVAADRRDFINAMKELMIFTRSQR